MSGELLARRTAIVIAGAVLLAAGMLFVENGARSPYPWINHDVAFLTWAGEELLRGARLYVEFEEMNPPGSHFLHAAIAAAAHGLGLSVILADHLFVLGLGLAGLLVLRAAARGGPGETAFPVVALAYLLVVLRGNFSNNIVPSAPQFPVDFGQREHLFALLFAPWVLWRASGARPSRAMAAFLLLLGYVSAFKPHWIFLLAVVEVWAIARERRLQAAVLVPLGAGALLPCLVLAALSWSSVTAFFGDVVPLMLRGGYQGYGMGAAAFFASPLHLQMAGAGGLFLLCAMAASGLGLLERHTLALLVTVVVASYLVTVLQGKFWSYHGMVYFAAVVVLGAYLVAVVVRGGSEGRTRLAMTAALMLGEVAAVAVSLSSLAAMLAVLPPKGQELVPLIRDHRKVMFLSTAADYAYAPLLLGTPTVGPWREHFRLTALLAIPDAAERNPALDAYAAEVAARIASQRPDLLLFAPASLGLPYGVHIHDVLAEHGAIPPGYERVPDDEVVAGDPRRVGWVVYRPRAGG